MSKKNPKGLSVSFRVDSGFLDHNNRVITAHNVDISRTADNVTYAKIDLHNFYEQIFGKALAEYNAKQKRADREIPNYYEHVKKSGNPVKPHTGFSFPFRAVVFVLPIR